MGALYGKKVKIMSGTGTKDVEQALKAAVPIFIGYIPAAVAFGILSKGTGITLLQCFLFSAVVFAGASQFIALNLLSTGMGPGGIILTTLLVNFRHFLMSASLSTRVSAIARRFYFPMAFGVTDEVFSILSFREGELTKTYVFALELSAYSAWVGGTVAGYVLGSFLPEAVAASMGVALYALLLAILLPELKKSMRSLVLAVAAGVLNTILIRLELLPDGWTMIVCILVIATIGAFLVNGEAEKKSDG